MTTPKIHTHQKTYIALSLAFLYVALLVLHLETAVWPFGIVDSPIILAQAILYSPIEYFSSPYKYQFLTYNNFTPWVTLSWDLDYNLFGLESLGYRVHHLVSAATLLGVFYLLLFRITHSVLNTSVFCFALISLPATIDVVTDLVNRHYLEGMTFCLLSVLFALTYARRRAVLLLAVSVLLYALSITAKEVFIPLPGILFFFLPGNLKQKIVLIAPYGVVLLGYLAWRFYMVGGTGGYSSPDAVLDLANNSQIYFFVIQRLFDSLFVSGSVTALMFALLALLLVINFKKMSLYTKTGLLVGALGVLLPLLALLPILSVGFFSGRWLFAPTVAFLVLFSYLCGITTSRRLSTIIYLIVFSCSVGAAYFYVQKPTPLFAKSNGSFYKQILLSDPERYFHTSNYSLLGQRAQAVWVYIAKLHNGAWGTLPISDVGQLRYHDAQSRTPITLGRKKPGAEDAGTVIKSDLDLVTVANYDPLSDTLTFSFADELDDKNCFVYIFGEHSGLLNKTADCRQWTIQYRELRYLLRMMGYSISDLSVAIWNENPVKRFYSKPYKLDTLIDQDS